MSLIFFSSPSPNLTILFYVIVSPYYSSTFYPRTQETKGTDTWDYSYDYANRLTRVEKNSTTLGECVYDGNGKRIRITEDNVTTTYVYSGLNVLYEANTAATATYIYGPTGRLAKRTTIQGETNTFYYHTDHQGSTRLVTDQSKDIVADVVYNPFGKSTLTGEEESHLYTGKEDETGLYYYGARYYDPDLGRFITRDPLSGGKSNPQSQNRYSYCVNNPIKLVDPTGLSYSMYNVDTGERAHYSEFGRSGIRLYDSEGDIYFSSQKCQDMIDAEDYVGAVTYVLEALDYDVYVDDPLEGLTVLHIGIGEIYTAQFFIYEPDDVLKLMQKHKLEEWVKAGKTRYMEQSALNRAWVDIYFFDNVNMTAAHLFHTVGHELQHAIHYCTGQFDDWVTGYKSRATALYYSEVMAYKWNLAHLYVISWLGAQDEIEQRIEYYLRLFFKSMK